VKLLVDMNLSPDWVTVFAGAGFEAVHWSAVGDGRATDADILRWARQHGHVVFTHDLDFGTLLALTQSTGPSVIQARTQDTSPAHLAPLVLAALHACRVQLEQGALVTVDEARHKVRILPI
jgi:predicted nuclease of predicted toxin-antitoxin system